MSGRFFAQSDDKKKRKESSFHSPWDEDENEAIGGTEGQGRAVTPSFLLPQDTETDAEPEAAEQGEEAAAAAGGEEPDLEHAKEQDFMNYEEYKQKMQEKEKEAAEQAPYAAPEVSAEEPDLYESAPAAEAEAEAEQERRPKKKKNDEKKSGRGFMASLSRAWRVTGIVLASVLLIFSIIGIVSTVGFIKRAVGDMDTPKEAGETLIRTLKEDDFDAYQKLLAGEETTANDKALFQSLRSSLDNDKDMIVSNFILIRLENGKQFLCSIYFDDDKGEYVIRSVQEVPLSMQNIFVAK